MKKLLVLLAAVFCMAAASDPSERLPDPGQEARARAMFAEVRCLVCQNESIDDSSAELAADLRLLVRDQIRSGKSDDQVRTYLTDRYGEFVLLKPAFSWGNAVLWGAPFLIVILGVLLLLRNLRTPRPTAELTEAEAARLAALAEQEQT